MKLSLSGTNINLTKPTPSLHNTTTQPPPHQTLCAMVIISRCHLSHTVCLSSVFLFALEAIVSLHVTVESRATQTGKLMGFLFAVNSSHQGLNLFSKKSELFRQLRLRQMLSYHIYHTMLLK